MKISHSVRLLTVLWISFALGLAGVSGCGPGGTPAPPESIAEPTDYDSPEYAEGEAESTSG